MRRTSYALMLGWMMVFGSGCIVIDRTTSTSRGNSDASDSYISVRGSGPIQTERRRVPGFHAITVGGNFELEISRGPAAVEIQAQQNILVHVVTRVENGRIVIAMKDNLSFVKPVHIIVTAPNIEAIDASGAAVVSFSGMRANKLDVQASGGSTLNLQGQVTNLTLVAGGASSVSTTGFLAQSLKVECGGGSRVTLEGSSRDSEYTCDGASTLDAQRVKSEFCKADASGASSIKLFASKELQAAASGASHVQYPGSAEVKLDSNDASAIDKL